MLNNPYVPGDPYSYDLKWLVAKVKEILSQLGTLDEAIEEKIFEGFLEHSIVQFKTVPEMLAADITDGSIVLTLGYHEEGDQGGLFYLVKDFNPDQCSLDYFLTLDNNKQIAIPVIVTPYVTPEMFGAYGDGETVTSEALQRSFDYAIDHSMDVSLNNEYLIDTSIQVKGVRNTYQGSGSKIIGNGYAKIKASAAMASMLELVPYTDTTAYGVKISGLYLEGNNLADAGIHSVVPASECIFEDLQITYCTDAIHMANNCYLNTFKNVRAYECTGWGIRFTGGICTSNVFEKCYTDNCANGYYINGQYSSMISCCADGVTGTVFNLYSFTGSLIACGSESTGFTTMFKIGGNSVVNILGGMFFGNPTLSGYYIDLASGSYLNIIGALLNYASANTSGALFTAAGQSKLRIRDTSIYRTFTGESHTASTAEVFVLTGVKILETTVTVDANGLAEIPLNPRYTSILSVATTRSGWIGLVYARSETKFGVKMVSNTSYSPSISDRSYPLIIYYVDNYAI